jgi:hypothetical protein
VENEYLKTTYQCPCINRRASLNEAFRKLLKKEKNGLGHYYLHYLRFQIFFHLRIDLFCGGIRIIHAEEPDDYPGNDK